MSAASASVDLLRDGVYARATACLRPRAGGKVTFGGARTDSSRWRRERDGAAPASTVAWEQGWAARVAGSLRRVTRVAGSTTVVPDRSYVLGAHDWPSQRALPTSRAAALANDSA